MKAKALLCGVWSLLFVSVVGLALLPVVAMAGVIDSGICGKEGDNLTWELTNDGTLIISGTGEMADSHPWYHSSVKEVVIQNGVTSIGDEAFHMCENLKHVIIPNTVSSIGDYAFDCCFSLESLVVPEGVASIGVCAFQDCETLESLTIPDSVINIERGIIRYCSNLRDLTLPNSDINISDIAFVECGALENVYFAGTPNEWINKLGNICNFPENVKIHCRCIISFNSNNGLDTMFDTIQTVVLDESNVFELPSCDFIAPEGKQFAGWAFAPDGEVISESTIDLSDNVVIYAIWEDVIGETEEPSNPVEPSKSNTSSESAKPSKPGNESAGNSNNNQSNVATNTNKPTTGKSSAADKWLKGAKGWWYSHADGSCTKNGWELINGKWYMFDASGWMKTGWIQSGGEWYYLGSDGAMKTGWIKDGSSWYYTNTSGVMQTGWLRDGNSWYYLTSSGEMATGWTNVKSAWYYLNSSGVMQTGWQKNGGYWYYLTSSGVMQTGWQYIANNWYYFNASGVMAANAWIGNYWVDQSGKMITDAWVDNGRYYVGSSGAWIQSNDEIWAELIWRNEQERQRALEIQYKQQQSSKWFEEYSRKQNKLMSLRNQGANPQTLQYLFQFL